MHHLQREAERVTPNDLLGLLQEFYHDRLALRLRHESAARAIGSYEVNNTYQYIIGREDVQLTWLRSAIIAMGGMPPSGEAPSLPPERQYSTALLEDDARQAQAFVDRWAAPVEAVTNARHRGMLRVILGETLEQKRFFELARAGRSDLLGRRADGAGTGGGVLPTRWLE